MADTEQTDYAYCAELLRNKDPDRWLAVQYAPSDQRRRLTALYAFFCELRRIPASVSEPPLGEIRLQWWRDAFQEIRDGKLPRAHPVVGEIAKSGIADSQFEDVIASLIDAGARPLYSEEFEEFADLENWLATMGGVVDGVAVKMLGGARDIVDAAVRAGTGFALAREGRHWAPRFGSDISQLSVAIAVETAPQLKSASGEIAPALLHLALTRAYAKRHDAPFDLKKRVLLFLAMAFGRF